MQIHHIFLQQKFSLINRFFLQRNSRYQTINIPIYQTFDRNTNALQHTTIIIGKIEIIYSNNICAPSSPNWESCSRLLWKSWRSCVCGSSLMRLKESSSSSEPWPSTSTIVCHVAFRDRKPWSVRSIQSLSWWVETLFFKPACNKLQKLILDKNN